MSFLRVDADWFLTGPTASGKTAIGLTLADRMGAERLAAEIVSLDSMAVYRGMDVGTAKPTVVERRRVPHHLIDVADVDQDYSIADYVAAAHRAAAEIRGRDRTPLFVGGTPLYLKALLRGLFVGPEADWELRKRLTREAEEQGAEAVHARLCEVDPDTGARLHPNDLRRVIRAIEVFDQTGVPISAHQGQFDRPRQDDRLRCIVLDRPREELNRRIDERVDAMFAARLVEETAALVGHGGGFSRTAGQAVGYREVLEHLAGVRDLASTIELVKLRTRQFAKRQMTWFRSLSECRFVAVDADETAEITAERILAL